MREEREPEKSRSPIFGNNNGELSSKRERQREMSGREIMEVGEREKGCGGRERLEEREASDEKPKRMGIFGKL